MIIHVLRQDEKDSRIRCTKGDAMPAGDIAVRPVPVEGGHHILPGIRVDDAESKMCTPCTIMFMAGREGVDA